MTIVGKSSWVLLYIACMQRDWSLFVFTRPLTVRVRVKIMVGVKVRVRARVRVSVCFHFSHMVVMM